jgi:hypothetical protein
VPDAQTLRAALDRDGLQDLDVQAELVPVERTDLPGR